MTLIRQDDLPAAAQLAHEFKLPLSQARVLLAQGDASAALRVLQPLRRQMQEKGWQDERLKVMVLQAVAHHAHGEEDKAVHLLGDSLVLAEPGGFIRIFVDGGTAMSGLLSEAAARGDHAGLHGQAAGCIYEDRTRSALAAAPCRAVEPARSSRSSG